MLTLYGFFNSSASYRVRIALELKGLRAAHVGVNIRTGVQNTAPYMALNPAGLVPTLVLDELQVTQSLAIIDHLDAVHPDPRLVPLDGAERARVLEIANLVACDMHPLNNLRVLNFLRGPLALTEAQKAAWTKHWLSLGFDALEALLPEFGDWCVGTTPTLADCCLVPQVANARRAGFDMTPYPRTCRIDSHARQHPAFAAAQPSAQPDFIPA